MKKILALVLISFVFFWGLKVDAGNSTTTFTEGSFLNLYIRYKLETGSTHLAQYKAIYRDDTREAYCLDPTSKLKTAYPYVLVTSNISKTLGITPELWEEIELIMHYGYRYGNHTNDEWHAITQMLIWEKLHPGGTYEYTNGYNGSTIKNKFASEKQEIENLVKEHLKRPSFTAKSYDLNIGEEITITDTNAKIQEYSINTTPGINVKLEGNKLKIKALTKGNNTITISKSYSVTGEPTAIYTDNEGGQTLGVAGDLPSYTDTININVLAGNINVNIKRGEDYYSNCDNNIKTLYGLYEGNTLLETFDASEVNNYLSKDLPYKDYYVKQISHACNDKEDQNIYRVTVNAENPNPKVDIVVEENYKELVFLKKYGNKYQNSYFEESNASFTIGDSHKNFSLTTDSLGIATIKLGYGSYVLKQVNGKDGYSYIPDQTIQVNDSTPAKYYFNLINEEIVGSIDVVIKRDQDYYSNCSNGNVTFYGLYEKESNSLIRTFSGEDNTYHIENLPLKEYYVKQLSNACNDKADYKLYETEITKEKLHSNINVTVLENYVELTINKKYGNYLDGKYTLERNALFTIGDDNKVFDLVTNTKGNARIKIGYGTYKLKQIEGKENYAFIPDKIITIDENTPLDYVIELINEEILSNIKVILKDEEGNLLSGVVVGLYKGTKKVNELVTNEYGEVYFTNLNLREYTLKQLSTPDGYEAVDNKETITLTKEDGLVIFINKKKVVLEEPQKDIFKNGEPEQVDNTEKEIDVPDTYVNGDGKVIKISSMLLTMAFYIFIYGKKKYFSN